MSEKHVLNCLQYELKNPGAVYTNDEWGYPSGIGSVTTYKQFPWRPLVVREETDQLVEEAEHDY